MVVLGTTVGVALLAVAAEALHARRAGRLAKLVHGPTGRPMAIARAAAPIKVLASAALAFGLTTLLTSSTSSMPFSLLDRSFHIHRAL